MDTLKYEPSGRWLPVSSAAMALRVSRQRVYQLINQGALVARKINGTWLVSAPSIDARIALLQAERR